MRAIVVLTLILAVWVGPVFGEIVVTNIVFESGESTTYTVPTGKVLVVEHAVIMTTDSALRYTPPGATLRVSLVGSSSGFTSFQPTFKAPAGALFEAEGLQAQHDANGMLFGLLVDPADLYAAIPGEIDWLTSGVAGLRGEVRLGSPQPRQVKLETSSNLLQPLWEHDPLVKVEPDSDKRKAPFTAPPVTEPVEFYRVNARARR